MKRIYLSFFLLGFLGIAQLKAQKHITDPYITLQEKRMVYHSWGGWRPSRGFLGLNPHYQAVWGILANRRNGKYKNGPDIRPLKPDGTQNIRYFALMDTKSKIKSFKEHTEKIAKEAEKEILSVSSVVAKADPLWLLYYSKELKPIQNYYDPFANVNDQAIDALRGSSAVEWYNEQMLILKERMESNLTQDMDRGQRVLGHHHILLDYRKLQKQWTNIIAEATKRKGRLEKAKPWTTNEPVRISWKDWNPNSDRDIMREVIATKSFK